MGDCWRLARLLDSKLKGKEKLHCSFFEKPNDVNCKRCEGASIFQVRYHVLVREEEGG